MICEVDDGSGNIEKSVIRFNTGTTINFSSVTTFSVNGKDYEIKKPKTTINTLNDDSDAVIRMSGNTCRSAGNCVVQHFIVEAPASAPFGVLIQNSSGAELKESQVLNSAAGGDVAVAAQNIYGPHSLPYVYIDSDWTTGVRLINNPGSLSMLRGFIDNLSGSGVVIDNIGSVLDMQVYVEDCGDPGLDISNCQSITIEYIRAATGSGDGILLSNCEISIDDLGGTGNGGYGVNTKKRVYLTVGGIPTITGTSGDATDDRGTSAIVWATDLASDGDLTSNTDYQVTIERDDSI